MKITILGWEYHNIRKMGNVKIDLHKSKQGGHPITLVMMQNGTGKTTTIELMRAVLSQSAVRWDEKKVKSFRPLSIEAEEGQFHLDICYGSKRYHYILHLNYVTGKAEYRTCFTGESGGLEDGRALPHQLLGIFDKEEFVNRFIFDGEQAKKTLSKENEEAEQAITYLYQIDKLDGLINLIDKLIEKKQAENKGTDQNVSNLKTRMQKAKRVYEDRKKEADQLKDKMGEVREKIKALQDKQTQLISKDETFNKTFEKLQEDLKSKKEKIDLTMQRIMKDLKKPYNIHTIFDQNLKTLAQNMQILKLPKATAREFFKELAHSPKCICGRSMGLKEREVILKNAEAYLGQEELAALNAIKHSLREYHISDEFYKEIDILNDLTSKQQVIQNSINRLKRQSEKSGNEQIKEISEQLRDLENETELVENRYTSITTTDYRTYSGLDETNNLKKAKEKYYEAEEKYLNATQSRSYTKQSQRIQGYIQAIRESALKKLKQNIISETNQKIQRIITNDKIEIKEIDKSIVLKDREAASEGQSLAVAYAYIGSLFEHSYFEFPFVVDSPAAAMDLDVRREVAKVIPKLFEQLIIFVTSGETAGFAESFYNMNDVQYITVEEAENGEINCISDKDYFSSYQSKNRSDKDAFFNA